jgi:hypothetical protein
MPWYLGPTAVLGPLMHSLLLHLPLQIIKVIFSCLILSALILSFFLFPTNKICTILGDNTKGSNFTFFSSFQSNLLTEGLSSQVGWGHVWSRFAGPLSCQYQTNQCSVTPVLPPAWWDGAWQSPTSRDVRRLAAYGVKVSDEGEVDQSSIRDFCSSRKEHVRNYQIIGLQN